MIIQHNIMALNAYGRLNTNNSNLGRNLEKLSSGYRINRAGDDAAGLAISEKMRAQIKGLETAQKNALDGVSLVQTAEGALTEVHSMLNRMVELATQAANGTYNDVDRGKLQDEVAALKDEIDRIAQATNFNGINLLDGSLGTGGAVTAGGLTKTEITGTGTTGDKATFTFDITDLEIKSSEAGNSNEFKIQVGSGLTLTADITFAASDTTEADIAAKLKAATWKDASNNVWTISGTGTGLTFTSSVSGASGVSASDKITITSAGLDTTALDDDDMSAFTDGTADTVTTAGKTTLKVDAANAQAGTTIAVGGTTYELVANAGDVTAGNTAILIGADATATALAIQTKLAADSVAATVTKDTVTITNTGNIAAPTITIAAPAAGGDEEETVAPGLQLQVGDTNDAYQKVSVSINSMSSQNIGTSYTDSTGAVQTVVGGLSSIDISTIGGAGTAIDVIKAAIEDVSTARAGLGAIQNRLEHTISNLGVTTENLTAAESRIRDTDMAKEMMGMVKNQILVQASQSMLAQANQVPQSVLQLLR